jgi:hypothetical protein
MRTHAPILYAGLTGAGLVKLGVTTCLAAREKAFQCVDPQYRTLYTVPESDMTEQELLRKIRSMGFRVGRSREVFDVSLSLVSDIMKEEAPRGGKSGRSLLSEFLEAELSPGLSVEKACYPSVLLFEMRCQPSPYELAMGRRQLYGAGLLYIEEDAFEPGYVILDKPLKFAEKFPHLKHVIPFVLHSKGVWVLSGASPVSHSGPTLVR